MHTAKMPPHSFLQIFFPASATVPGLAIHTKDMMYIVDSGASLHMMGLSSLSPKEKRTTRKSDSILDFQT